jgi:hypothetical protein
MAKKDLGECVGKCSVCTINLWSSTEGKPAVWPCNIGGCPYEDPKKQNSHISEQLASLIGSGLSQIDF